MNKKQNDEKILQKTIWKMIKKTSSNKHLKKKTLSNSAFNILYLKLVNWTYKQPLAC